MTNEGMVVRRAGAVSSDTSQTPGMIRRVAIDAATAGSRHLWVGKVVTEPGTSSGRHHHGEAETVGYVLTGTARIYFGGDYEKFVDMNEGDFVYIPPYLPHIETNPSRKDLLTFITIRSPDNIVINLE